MSSVCILKLKVQFCTQRKGFEECTQNLTYHVGRAKASLWLRLCWKFALQNVGRFEWVQSQKRLSTWRCKDWQRLHDSIVTAISRYTQVPVTLMGLHQVLSSIQQTINEFRHALQRHHVSPLGELHESACKEILSWKNEGEARIMATTAIQKLQFSGHTAGLPGQSWCDYVTVKRLNYSLEHIVA